MSDRVWARARGAWQAMQTHLTCRGRRGCTFVAPKMAGTWSVVVVLVVVLSAAACGPGACGPGALAIEAPPVEEGIPIVEHVCNHDHITDRAPAPLTSAQR
jgi:hypothetical protein